MTTKFQRIVALFLAVCTFLGCFMLTVSASDKDTAATGTNSVTSSAIANAKELLNTISYAEYLALYKDETAYPKATESIVVQGVDYYAEKTDAKVSVETYNGITALSTPDSGDVTWKVNVPKTAKYAIKLNYWPIEDKPTSIQRSFKINGEVPFVEAYYITLSKV